MEIIDNGATSPEILRDFIEIEREELYDIITRIKNHKGIWTIVTKEKIKTKDLLYLIDKFEGYFYYDDLNIQVENMMFEYVGGNNLDKRALAGILIHGTI
jgi:hypothetical protein